jgi:hypothetical protein
MILLRAFQARNEPRHWLDMHAVTACFLHSMRPALSSTTPSQPPVFLACPPPPPLLLFALILPCRPAAAAVALSDMVNSDLLLLPAHPCSTPCTTDTATTLHIDGRSTCLYHFRPPGFPRCVRTGPAASCCSPQVPCVSGAPDQGSDDEVTCKLQP